MSETDPDKAADKMFDVVQDMGQHLVEIICSDEVLKNIPFIKLFVAGTTAVRAVRDEILIRKLEAFMEPLTEIAPDERRDMVERLESDPNYQRKVGEHIIEVLDRQDSRRKPTINSRIFLAFARKEIDLIVFHRLLNAIERLPVTEIDTVRRFVESIDKKPERQKIDGESIQAMENAGLLSSGYTMTFDGGGTTFSPTMTCRKFLELDLDMMVKGAR